MLLLLSMHVFRNQTLRILALDMANNVLSYRKRSVYNLVYIAWYFPIPFLAVLWKQAVWDRHQRTVFEVVHGKEQEFPKSTCPLQSNVPAVHIEPSFLLCIVLNPMQSFCFVALITWIPLLGPMAGFEAAAHQVAEIWYFMVAKVPTFWCVHN